MKHSTLLTFATLAASLVCTSALAQTRFCIGGDLDHLSQAQRTSCNAKNQAVKAAATALHAPDDWHFVLVCGDEGWKNYASYISEENTSLMDAAANTDLQQHETFLRADRLDLNSLRSVQKLVAHEVAGIVLHSNDEVAIARQMKIWTDQGSTQSGM